MRRRSPWFLMWCAVGILLAGCRGPRIVVLPPAPPAAAPAEWSSPRDEYVDSLRRTGADRTPLAAAWTAAARQACRAPLAIPLPFREAGYVAPEQPLAVCYRLPLQRGQRLVVDGGAAPETPFTLFVDLFAVEGTTLRFLASATSGAVRLQFEVVRDGSYLLRLQPELGRGGRYSLAERVEAAYAVPVAGVDPAAIADTFHDTRENGRRQHDGVDIFAPRGTEAVAAVDGVVTRTTTGGLGGNAVWLWDPVRSVSLYYAHLDKWLVRAGEPAKAGQPIGLVGNTGNASSGATHLHFGIYAGQGAIDPLPFLRASAPPAVGVDLDALGHARRTITGLAALMETAGSAGREMHTLAVGTLLWVEAGAGQLYRVRLPDGAAGFVLARATEEVTLPLRTMTLTERTDLVERPIPSGPLLARLDPGTRLQVLATFGGYLFVRLPRGDEGWIAER